MHLFIRNVLDQIGKGDTNDKGNYRPISVIGHTCIAKSIEREITNQVVTYLESNNLLTSDQSAYLAQHSTQTALHKVVDTRYKSIYWQPRRLDCHIHNTQNNTGIK